MDFAGQKLAEQICLYLIVASGVVSFTMGYAFASFALMIKVLVLLLCVLSFDS